MSSVLVWTVGRRLAAIAAAGVLTTVALGVTGLQGLADVRTDSEALDRIEQARVLVHQLDTRASELKVDGYKTLVMARPADAARRAEGRHRQARRR